MENPFLNLQPANNAGNAFMQAFQQGQQNRQQTETRNALSKYATNPDDPAVFSELSRWNPEMAIKLRDSKREMALKELEAHKDQIQIGAAILSANQPHDQASWDAAKTEAARYGIDVSHLPPSWDAQAQQYVQSVIAADRHINPQKQERPQVVTTQAGGGVFRIDENGNAVPLILPNDGSHQAGSPVVPPPPPGFVIDGGPTPPASGNFPR